MKYPKPLSAGSTIAITAFSSGIEAQHEARYRVVLNDLESQGYKVIEGQCINEQAKHVSAPAEERAAELMAFLLDDSIDAIAPPWGGELAIELLSLLDFEALKKAKPKWLFGFSDVSTITAVLATKLNWATAHSANLMDITNAAADPLTSNVLKYLSTDLSGEFTQASSPQYTHKWPAIDKEPTAILVPDTNTNWRWLVEPKEGHSIEGQLIGGCWDTLAHLFGTDYLDINKFSGQFSEGVLLYLENVDMAPTDLVRTILSMKFKGVFDQIQGLMLGRTSRVDSDNSDDLTYYEVLDRHLTNLGIPVIIDMDIGHVPPNLTLINGAMATVTLEGETGSICQKLI